MARFFVAVFFVSMARKWTGAEGYSARKEWEKTGDNIVLKLASFFRDIAIINLVPQSLRVSIKQLVSYVLRVLFAYLMNRHHAVLAPRLRHAVTSWDGARHSKQPIAADSRGDADSRSEMRDSAGTEGDPYLGIVRPCNRANALILVSSL